MRKLTLDFDTLRIESFTTGTAEGTEAGTVRGHQGGPTRRPTCGSLCTNTQPIVSCYDPCG